ncbi:hypothetical protein L21TH_0515 [Caldisalinibacter kiritimatiensis]|uniref:Actin-like protein N-terminal domain-containing protein n=2 Tax=Caldisalinibacter kiritimatiensis TaxID=1304284 RepID=R1AWD7_9FIRM|nr:hypothetical protein L21TH_0515 [Caldisalinibacter kiritimatiensis]
MGYTLKELINFQVLKKILKYKGEGKMRKLIACEVGNFDTKLVGEEYKQNKEDKVSVLNIVSRARYRRSYGKKVKNLINLLDVTIESPSLVTERWFVGGLAFKEGEEYMKPTRVTKKAENPQTIIQLLTTIAYYLYDSKNPKKTETIALSTLLPTEEYWSEEKDYIKILEDKLKGKHKVIFNDEAFNGAEITLDIERLLINPEGAVGQIACVYGWDGNVRSDIVDYEFKTILNIDIGSIDTDVSILKEGDFLEKGNFGIKGRHYSSVKRYCKRYKTIYGHEFDIHKLDYHLRTKRPLYIGNKEINKEIYQISEKHFSNSAKLLADKISEELQDRRINKYEINITNMIGGGTPFFKDGFINHFANEYMEIKVPEDPRFANAEGALKALLFEMQQSSQEDDEIFGED